MINSYSEVSEGYYYVRKGDTSRSVANVVYGDQNKASRLVKANPEQWDPESHITVPGVSGRLDTMKPGESVTKVCQRVFPGQPVHLFQNRFYVWNGGQNRQFGGGEMIFIPNR